MNISALNLSSQLFRVVLCIHFIAFYLPAQQYSFRYYGAEDGLTNLKVKTLFQDRDGFLWAGTDNGIFRFDGSRFIRFGAEEGLPRESAISLGESPGGHVLAAYKSGLYQLEGDRFEKLSLPCSGGFDANGGIQYDFIGRTYFSTTCGLLAAEASGGSKDLIIQKVSDLSVPGGPATYGLYVDQGIVWYGCGSGICRKSSSGIAVFGEASGLPAGKWISLRRDGGGDLWANNGTGFAVMRHGGTKFEKANPGLPQSAAGVPFQADSEGRLLFPGAEGLSIFESANVRAFGWRENLRGAVISVLQDREGSIWLGLDGHGLARWRGYTQWQGFSSSSGLDSERIYTILPLGNGNVICGTADGLYVSRKSGEKWIWERNQNIGKVPIHALALEGDGGVWFCAAGRGAARFDPRTGKVEWIQDSALSGSSFLSLNVDRSRRIWIGTESGLFVAFLGDRRFRRVEAVPPAECRVIRQGSQGEILAGTAQGLFILTGDKWQRISTGEGLLSSTIQAVASSGPGEFWVGYGDSGSVTRIQLDSGRPSMTHFGKDVGLRGNMTSFLGVDSRGWLWRGSDEGAWARTGENWRWYDHKDGLIQDDCSGGGFASSPDGTVWFGTSGGLASFTPGPRTASDAKYPVVLTNPGPGIGKSAAAGIATYSRSDSLTFRVAVLNFSREGFALYRYRLEPVLKDWRETSQSELHFAGLQPGTYFLQVQSQDGSGRWSDKPAELAFGIEFPWWRSLWFLGLLILVMLFLIYCFWRWMINRQTELRRESESAVALRTEEVAKARSNMELEAARAEKEKQRADDLSRANKEFLVRMSHGMRTPMNGILGMSDLLRESGLNPKQRSYAEMLRSSAAALWVTINDLMDYSKIEAGKLEWENVDFDLRKTVDQVLRPVVPHIHQKGLEINRIIDPEVPNALKGDPMRLRQVLRHLLGNAVKFTDAGEVNLRIHCESLDTEVARLRFSLEDTGIGIAEVQKERLFEAFSPADESSGKLVSGFGLGLAVSSQLVQKMDGRLWVDSVPGKGSTFHFTATFGLSEASGDSLAQGDAHFDGMRVLVVDDNQTSRQYLAKLLEKWGLKPSMATDGAQALREMENAFARSRPFSLLLADSDMPGMDGFELINRVRADKRFSRTSPVLLISSGKRDEAAQCREIGIKEFVTKPVPEPRLRRVLARAAGFSTQRATVSAPQMHLARAGGAGLHILLVEDNPVCQKVASHALGKFGCHVVIADDGRQALEQLEQGNFDLVLMDLEMPNMNGLEATAAIRQKEAGGGAHIPILALTSFDMPGDRDRCLTAGMDGYMTKPIRARELMSMIQSLTGHRPGAQEKPA